MSKPTVLLISTEGCGFYRGYDVYFNGVKAYHRPYDGSDAEEVEREAVETLASLVREKLGLSLDSPENDWE